VVLAGVVFAGGWAAVVGAVDLDGEFELGPVEVHLEAVEVGVDEGLLGDEREEGVFGAASGAGAAAVVGRDLGRGCGR
jgi:hypothetical protein